MEPLVRPLPRDYSPEYCFERLAHLNGCVWLDSSTRGGELGQFSYMAVDPFRRVRIDKGHPGALSQIAQIWSTLRQPKLQGLPPMQGGWMGWLGYELGSCFERIPAPQFNEFHLPLASLGLYDVVLSWDHWRDEGWIVSQGWPLTEPADRCRHASRRLNDVLQMLETHQSDPVTANMGCHPLHPSRLAPQYSTRWSNEWTSNFSSSGYRDAVRRCTEYIHAGDIFQVNISQRLLRRSRCGSKQLYQHLRRKSPSPFSGYADLGRVQVLSSSPERFLSLCDGRLETRPIKGTRPRLSDPTADVGMGALLSASEKDRSENVMIVDLMRNDLSRVSLPDSVKVSSLCGLEQYAHVWHLVSVIQSRLGLKDSALDVVSATFPGGSITGAPKIRAMEIIAEIEPTARGPYCGSLGYISCAGDMDLNILIRTVTACDGWWQIPVGGGIVFDSDANLEEQETWHKADGLLRAIDSLPT